MAKKAATGKAMSKTEVYSSLAEKSGLSKKEVQSVFEALGELISEQLGNKGPGVFTVPGMMKLKAVHKPATKERPGKNPFTGEDIIIKAKPASKSVKVTALKGLKDMV